MFLHIFNITEINKSKALTKHILCKCECKYDSRKSNLNQKLNIGQCPCKCKNPKEHCLCKKKNILGILQHLVANNDKYVASIIDNSVIM